MCDGLFSSHAQFTLDLIILTNLHVEPGTLYAGRQRTTTDVSAVAFAAVERQSSSSNNSRNPDDQSGNNSDHDNHVVLHCVDSSGTMFEASTFGVVWNIERDSSGPADAPADAATAGRGWHVCADLEASLLVRETVQEKACFCGRPPA